MVIEMVPYVSVLGICSVMSCFRIFTFVTENSLQVILFQCTLFSKKYVAGLFHLCLIFLATWFATVELDNKNLWCPMEAVLNNHVCTFTMRALPPHITFITFWRYNWLVPVPRVSSRREAPSAAGERKLVV